MPDRSLCGWRVRSDLALPELPIWQADDRSADITIRLAAVPEALVKVTATDPHGDLGPDGMFLLREVGVGRYLVGASEVNVQAEVDTGSPLLRSHLYGTVLGVLCHRRGLLPLHASCLVRDGRAVLLAGARGSGKSTLAAVLAQRGFGLLADDVTPIVWRDADMPTALPGVPCLRLTPSALDILALSLTAALEPAYGKMAVPGAVTPWLAPAPVEAVFHLAPDPRAPSPQCLKLGRPEAVGALYQSCFRGRLAHKMGLGAVAFAAVARLATQRPAYRLVWCHDPARLDDLARLVAETLAEGAGTSWT